ncbi:large subunit ribosomal protein LP0 [Rhizophagus irregularis]|uniref:60S acidic ribosomal protein P0 n=3 Tax=Rhizophagus irregularis TaxID=588596 RepID=A0A2I1EZE5_9GLOM|nr:large subunit ribosomal protein LP0 [Rhizophagus irregularis DAOM 181602=DAOM 197198]EXX73581.1 ribosomal protein P0 [Rhizophagus irregularis DAOM 197198w]PKC04336.1 large subunit ribosomal protein LP0 [Rhizophagus irregularis]EXX73582.1 ribosomal protein P0 [Rhizophagus irregularis DAOM 197198w]PKC60631.1 large subunit ribosomal protein LP0 [Rhizophagus irregularis]PKY27492.1 large subunit ribosomal protein LP0 [Rhizophagus irregularis]|eukprot:XP_025165727.1 large subunit ribosomal protein LP0 [Rhizophagus irregularis DAOM 181602=DAOM 197198]
MSKGDVRTKKFEYFNKLKTLLEEYPSIFIVNVDNVGSNQMHQIRHTLRRKAVVLMGKNTMVRRALKGLIPENAQYEKLLPHVKGNVGFVFTNGDLKETRDVILSNRVKAPAKAGAIAPIDVFVPAGNTGMEPGKTSFFQALGVPTKIARGTIEIINQVHLVKKETKVGASEATLLNMLNISPFTYGMTVTQIFDNGTTFHPSVLDIEEDTLISHLLTGIRRIAALSLQLHYPTLASIPHSLINGFKNLLAISVATEYTFPASEKIKAYLADPSAFAAAAPAAAAAADETKESAPVKEEEPDEETDEDMGLDLFG